LECHDIQNVIAIYMCIGHVYSKLGWVDYLLVKQVEPLGSFHLESKPCSLLSSCETPPSSHKGLGLVLKQVTASSLQATVPWNCDRCRAKGLVYGLYLSYTIVKLQTLVSTSSRVQAVFPSSLVYPLFLSQQLRTCEVTSL
jgi:hypothetical protein